jgi:acyl-[acyl-carrier-protein]-phospholipid O-acyltransferase / long-chain-fatty-acid--[acyl-carrier-protein] ligase
MKATNAIQSLPAESLSPKTESALLLALRKAAWVLCGGLMRLLYRIRVRGCEHLPRTGGALLVCNHVSMIDPFFIGKASGRYVRFLMHQRWYEKFWVKPFARLLGIISISSEQGPRELSQSLRAAREAVRKGDLVCIFAEGQVTRIGQLLPFRRGFERIVKGVEAPIIPVSLEGVWGSIFSFEGGRCYWKWPKRILAPVTVSFGKPMPPGAATVEVRQAVQELSSEAWIERKGLMQPLHRSFVRTARRHPFRFAMGDLRMPRMNFFNALARTVYVARRLRPFWEGQDKVGVLLPPSVGGALVNLAALFMGKVPVNLNYTTSEETIASCVRQCGIKTVVSSRAFLEKVKLQTPGRLLLLEEIAANPRFLERLAAFLICLLPAPLVERSLGNSRGPDMDDLATIIFSSGSTGEPKGVMQSHFNIASNVDQLEQVFRLTGRDRMLGVLPFFHSFGFTGTLCLTGSLGLGVCYHPTPLDAEAVGRLVRKYAVTFLLTTPTFLQLYLRGCAPEDFGSLRVVIAGAEKLPERLAIAFEDKFGIRPLEGYGCTECAPVVAASALDHRSAGYRQVGARRGKVGRPLPGMSLRVVDPATHRALPFGEPGLLLVRGPNVMPGYLGRLAQTAEVLREGWYETGDIAMVDEEGFLQITDRLSRFSKIGGEMVPHIKIEEKLHELAGAWERQFVVTGVGDEKKGERLVVLHCLDEASLRAILDKLPGCGLPNLWIPKRSQFFQVEEMPALGSGKLDLRKVRELAESFADLQPAITQVAARTVANPQVPRP